jgi:hypothetical protein
MPTRVWNTFQEFSLRLLFDMLGELNSELKGMESSINQQSRKKQLKTS